jgi:drug/metabolite transporter (DMT)-like permease
MRLKKLAIKYLDIKIKMLISGSKRGATPAQATGKDGPMNGATREATGAAAHEAAPASGGAGGTASRGGTGGFLEQPLPLLLIVGGFLAVSTVIAKAAPGLGWHPLALLQWSILGGAAGLFLITHLAGSGLVRQAAVAPVFPDRKLMVYLVVSGLLFIAPNMIAVAAAPRVGAGFVSLCYAFPLVLTYALAVLLRLDRLEWLRGAGVLAGLAGGVLLAVSGRSLALEASFWSLLALAIPLFLAGGNIYRTLHWPEGARPVDLALGMMLTGFVALALFNAVTGTPVTPDSWTPAALWLLAAQIAIFALQYGLYFRLQQAAGPVYLSQIGSVAAVTGLGLGYLVFGEIPDAARLAAVAAVGAGIVLVSLGRRMS